MMKSFNFLADGAEYAVRQIGQIVAWSGLILVLVVAFNVCARYLFSFGAVALQEVEWHLLAISALFGMSYALNQGEQVRVDVLYGSFSPKMKNRVNVLSSFLLAISSLIIAYLSLNFVSQSYLLNEASADPGGLPARWLLKAMIPAAFFLLALQSFASMIRDIAALKSINSSSLES